MFPYASQFLKYVFLITKPLVQFYCSLVSNGSCRIIQAIQVESWLSFEVNLNIFVGLGIGVEMIPKIAASQQDVVDCLALCNIGQRQTAEMSRQFFYIF